MKKINVFLILFIFSLVACTTIREIPVEVIKKEYINNYITDTFYRDRAIFYKEKGDTVYIHDKEYIYKYKCETDTFLKTDTIKQVVYKEVEVNRLKKWQISLMILGGVFIGILILKLKNILK